MNPEHFYSSSIDVVAPPARVWKIMSDVGNWPQWTPTVRRVRRKDTGPLRIGSSAWVIQPKIPPARWKVTWVEENRGFIWISFAPGVKVTASHLIEEIPGGSRVTLSLTYSGLFAALMARLTATINDLYLGLEARALKKISEEPAAI
ncbi:MAG TPA: SRPBCC family protein [Bacteroidota bacterium]|nr:SRPBCC family protein [Bacteroidota bacterium]